MLKKNNKDKDSNKEKPSNKGNKDQEKNNNIISLDIDSDEIKKEEKIVPKNNNSKNKKKNRNYSSDIILTNRKRKNDNLIETLQDNYNNNKEIKSAEISCKYYGKYFAEKAGNYKEIFEQKWKNNIKSVKIDEEGNVKKKLGKDELILNKCQEKAILKLKEHKEDINIKEKDLYNILSYDNINSSLLYFCFKKIDEDENELENLLEEFKYCFCDNSDIVDYFNDNKIININISKEFKYKFPFKDIKEGINALKETIENLLNLASEFVNFGVYKKLKKEEITQLFTYTYDELKDKSQIIDKSNYFHELGAKWLKYYLKLKDIKKFKANQPITYENNNILYISSCLYDIYEQLIFSDNKENNSITINGDYLNVSNNTSSLLMSLIEDLNIGIINEEFHSKIRFFYIIFEADDPENCEEIDFMQHIFKQNIFDEKQINNCLNTINSGNNDKTRNSLKCLYSSPLLTVQKSNKDIIFNINDYDNTDLIEMLSVYPKKTEKEIFGYSWKKNSLSSFQNHNYLLKEDIDFLKSLLKDIFKSKFWEDICSKYCTNDFIPDNFFKEDEFINQLIKKIIFLPFYIEKHGYFAYTTADDLCIFISGYPYVNNNLNLEKYKVKRILQLAISVIVLMHEAVHFYKRLFYFITCHMVLRTTILDNKREEGGNIFEEIVFGWKNPLNKNIYLDKALDILNSKTYENGLDFAKDVFTKKKSVKEKADSLKEYLLKLDLSDEIKLNNFINKNKRENANAAKEYLCRDFMVNYNNTHRYCKGWK